MKFPTREMKRARIEIIPMIDTIFFLLVFFMITSLTMVRMKAMSVALPKNTPPAGSINSIRRFRPAAFGHPDGQ